MGAAGGDLTVSLQRFAESVAGLPFQLDMDGADVRDALVQTVREYILPRLADLHAPLVAVILGSTGAGKSTVLNSLAGHRVTIPGAIRPTTTDPVIWCHPDHVRRYERGFLSGYGLDEPRRLNVVADDRLLLKHLTVIDTPDIDSVETLHHEVAADLRRVADIVIFVTSAQRYADQVPWDVLDAVQQRGTPVVFVLNRLPRDAQPLVADFDRRRRDHGFPAAPVAVIAEVTHRADRDLLQDELISPLRSHLAWLARDGRRLLTRRTGMRGALEHMVLQSALLQQALDREAGAVHRLVEAVDGAYVTQQDELHHDLDRGELIKAEVLERWQEFVGTGELLKAAAGGIDKVRSWARSSFGGRPRVDVVQDQAHAELVVAVTRRVQVAVNGVVAAWEQTPVGQRLLAADGGAGYRPGPDVEEHARRAVIGWTADLARMVETEGEGRRKVATVASTGVNAVAVVALLATFANTGGITGAEVGITAGAAAAQQRVLEHVFGSAAARTLVARGRSSLHKALSDVLAADSRRYRDVALDMTAGATQLHLLDEWRRGVARDAAHAGMWADSVIDEGRAGA